MKKLALMCLVFLLLVTVFSTVFVTSAFAVTEDVTVYFYNSKGWQTVYAHCYVSGGSDFTVWPGDELDRATELGNGWYKYTLPSQPSASLWLQFNNGTEDNFISVNVSDSTKVYFNAYRRSGFTSAQEALANNSEQVIESSGTTRIYFYNSKRWKSVYAYVYGTDGVTEYTRGWPGNVTSKDEERENWYYIDIEQDCEKVPFNIIFNNHSDGSNNKSRDTLINKKSNVYVNVIGRTYVSYEACEAVTKLEDIVEEEILDPNDFYLDFGSVDTNPKTVTAVNSPSPDTIFVASVVAAVSVVICIILAILLLRRRKND